MDEQSLLPLLGTALFYLVHFAFVARAILRPHREPVSRIAWVVVIMVAPIAGIVAYILLGETSVGRRRAARMRNVLKTLPDPATSPEAAAVRRGSDIPERYMPLFRMGQSVNEFEPLGGNQARLMPDSNAAIDSLVADIDAAKEHVHVIFYIWLPDNNGVKVVEALSAVPL